MPPTTLPTPLGQTGRLPFCLPFESHPLNQAGRQAGLGGRQWAWRVSFRQHFMVVWRHFQTIGWRGSVETGKMTGSMLSIHNTLPMHTCSSLGRHMRGGGGWKMEWSLGGQDKWEEEGKNPP